MKTRSRIALAAAAAFTVSSAALAAEVHWNYDPASHEGPAHWGELDPSYEACSIGLEQSGIAIREPRYDSRLKDLEFAYQAYASMAVVNNGHTIQVNMPAGSTAKIQGTFYDLLQFHFHTPAENTKGAGAYPMVLHLVHKSEVGTLAVVAVWIKSGAYNAEVEKVIANTPATTGTVITAETMVVDRLRPAKRGFYNFVGSLTTPPCNEGVRWQVMDQPIEASPDQILRFQNVIGPHGNARPLQRANGRVIRTNDSALADDDD